MLLLKTKDMYTSDDMKKKELYPVLWKVFREAPYPESNIIVGAVLSYLDVSNYDALAQRMGGSSQAVSLILELVSVVSFASVILLTVSHSATGPATCSDMLSAQFVSGRYVVSAKILDTARKFETSEYVSLQKLYMFGLQAKKHFRSNVRGRSRQEIIKAAAYALPGVTANPGSRTPKADTSKAKIWLDSKSMLKGLACIFSRQIKCDADITFAHMLTLSLHLPVPNTILHDILIVCHTFACLPVSLYSMMRTATGLCTILPADDNYRGGNTYFSEPASKILLGYYNTATGQRLADWPAVGGAAAAAANAVEEPLTMYTPEVAFNYWQASAALVICFIQHSLLLSEYVRHGSGNLCARHVHSRRTRMTLSFFVASFIWVIPTVSTSCNTTSIVETVTFVEYICLLLLMRRSGGG